jgi:exosome complex exonuclease RRP6
VRRPDNHTETPWRPTLAHKYHAQVPLGYIFRDGVEIEDNKHPYHYEITNFQHPSRMFQPSTPVAPKSFADTPFTWVDTPAAFASMLDALRRAPEIAIDLEHHDYRTFGGFVCLMQISTREEDWIVDTLALRDELEELNEVFTDPNVVKVRSGILRVKPG